MSTQSIDISKKNVSGKCDLKCAYNFQYPESNTTAKNQDVLINLSYDNSKSPPVTYNTQKYTVTQTIITYLMALQQMLKLLLYILLLKVDHYYT
jgi:hypothetical protein